ncbi:MAG: PaaI family thioesterase, partial [Gammaproteobacteria bacterium]|nr:PaaI family thioesterase [Gammaproteobacteria bacterium]
MSEFIAKDSFATLLGIEVISAENGNAVAEMTIKPEHHNGHGTVHGGVIFSLADIAFAAASNSNATAIGIPADIRDVNNQEG